MKKVYTFCISSSCTLCGSPFDSDPVIESFTKKMVFTFGKVKIHPDVPKQCPQCRLKLRTCHRNERYLYKRKSDFSGKDIIAIYHRETMIPRKVYALDEWHSEAWDPLSYGRDFDFTRPFFEQFGELLQDVPKMAVVTVGNENCDYTTGTGYCKNCYLINSSEYCEDCSYGKLLQKCRNSYDCHYLFDSELCYECFSVHNSYQCRFLSFSKNCSDCHYSLSLIGCKNCFLCSNLERKEYCFKNKQLTKEEYQKSIADYENSWTKQQTALKELGELRKHSMHKAVNMLNCENCTGDYIENSQNCTESFDVNGSQDCRYLTVGVETKDCVDCSNMYIKPELCFMTMGTIETYNCAYCLYVFHSQNLLYSENCYHSKNLFACSGLKHQEYCIFNKKYSKEAYEELVPRIIEHMRTDGKMAEKSTNGVAMNPNEMSGSWGQYIPASLSPLGYNESVAHEYMSLAKDEAKKLGFHWRDTVDEVPNVVKIITANDLPDSIDSVPDDILEWAIRCEVSSRPYRIQKPELQFYRQCKLPIPHRHPDVRYDDRLKLRNPRTLYERTCEKCQKKVQSTFAPDRSETIVCEECYRKSM